MDYFLWRMQRQLEPVGALKKLIYAENCPELLYKLEGMHQVISEIVIAQGLLNQRSFYKNPIYAENCPELLYRARRMHQVISEIVIAQGLLNQRYFHSLALTHALNNKTNGTVK